MGEGSGGPGYMIDLEDSKLPHDFGVISMARSGDPNSNGSQILCLSREATRAPRRPVHGFRPAISGAEVINKIADTPSTAASGEPAQDQEREACGRSAWHRARACQGLERSARRRPVSTRSKQPIR